MGTDWQTIRTEGYVARNEPVSHLQEVAMLPATSFYKNQSVCNPFDPIAV